MQVLIANLAYVMLNLIMSWGLSANSRESSVHITLYLKPDAAIVGLPVKISGQIQK